MLQYSATKLHNANGVVYDALTQGAGEINGEGALYLAYFTDTSQPVGAQWLTYAVTPSTTFGGTETVAWNQSIVWGTDVASGPALININQAAWARNIVWGDGDNDNILCGAFNDDDNIVWGNSIDSIDNVVWSNNIVWGDDVVWGNRSIWSTNIVWGDALIGFFDGQNLIWSSMDGDNIVWGSLDDDNIVWGSSMRVYSLYFGSF